MKRSLTPLLVFLAIFCVSSTFAQDDEICREFGESPGRDVGRDNRQIPYVYGRVVLSGYPPDAKRPRVTVMYSDTMQPATRQVVGRSGNYCFAKRGTGGILVVEVEGIETARKPVSDISVKGQREDFEIYPPRSRGDLPPGVVSAKPARPPNDKTVGLYQKAVDAASDSKPDRAIEIYKQIVVIDPEDFIAWSMLGSLYVQKNAVGEAEAAFIHSLELKGDHTPALLSMGMIAALRNDFTKAIGYFEKATSVDPPSPRAFRLLGEAYLQNRQGNKGLAALDRAIELDPIGMAECHLLEARLYDLAGAKALASAQYKAFLAKVPDHPDRKKFEKYIKDNPPQ